MPTLFADGYPLLVIGQASLDDFNEKWVAQGHTPVPMNRFRPNLVIHDIGPYEEDYAQSIQLGNAVLHPIKPCSRCALPAVDQQTGEVGPSPLDVLQTFRVNPKLDGGISFGMNCIVGAGEGEILRVGQAVELDLAF